jgi:PTS system nitrogen regulatory IIA component
VAQKRVLGIADVLRKESVMLNLKTKSKPEVIRELAEPVTEQYPNLSRDNLVSVLLEREKLCSTAVDEGVAIPHGKISGLSNIIAAFGRSVEGIDFESLDGNPTHLFILLLAPESSSGIHLKLLARISRIFKNPEFRSRLMEAQTEEELYSIIIEEDAKI